MALFTKILLIFLASIHLQHASDEVNKSEKVEVLDEVEVVETYASDQFFKSCENATQYGRELEYDIRARLHFLKRHHKVPTGMNEVASELRYTKQPEKERHQSVENLHKLLESEQMLKKSSKNGKKSGKTKTKHFLITEMVKRSKRAGKEEFVDDLIRAKRDLKERWIYLVHVVAYKVPYYAGQGIGAISGAVLGSIIGTLNKGNCLVGCWNGIVMGSGLCGCLCGMFGAVIEYPFTAWHPYDDGYHYEQNRKEPFDARHLIPFTAAAGEHPNTARKTFYPSPESIARRRQLEEHFEWLANGGFY